MPDKKEKICKKCGSIYSYKLDKNDEWVPFCNNCDYEKNMGNTVRKALKKAFKSLGWKVK